MMRFEALNSNVEIDRPCAVDDHGYRLFDILKSWRVQTKVSSAKVGFQSYYFLFLA